MQITTIETRIIAEYLHFQKKCIFLNELYMFAPFQKEEIVFNFDKAFLYENNAALFMFFIKI